MFRIYLIPNHNSLIGNKSMAELTIILLSGWLSNIYVGRSVKYLCQIFLDNFKFASSPLPSLPKVVRHYSSN